MSAYTGHQRSGSRSRQRMSIKMLHMHTDWYVLADDGAARRQHVHSLEAGVYLDARFDDVHYRW